MFNSKKKAEEPAAEEVKKTSEAVKEETAKAGTAEAAEKETADASALKKALEAAQAEAENIRNTALILVGRFLGDDYELSKLFDASFSHGFRAASK